jgi:hypothetical protein
MRAVFLGTSVLMAAGAISNFFVKRRGQRHDSGQAAKPS